MKRSSYAIEPEILKHAKMRATKQETTVSKLIRLWLKTYAAGEDVQSMIGNFEEVAKQERDEEFGNIIAEKMSRVNEMVEGYGYDIKASWDDLKGNFPMVTSEGSMMISKNGKNMLKD